MKDKTMRALIFNAPGDVQVEDKSAQPPRPQEVAVALEATGICAGDHMAVGEGES